LSSINRNITVKLVINDVVVCAMAGCVAAPHALPNKPRRRLEVIVRRHSSSESLVMRAAMILRGAAGAGLRETA
jgi:hypothetical protein